MIKLTRKWVYVQISYNNLLCFLNLSFLIGNKDEFPALFRMGIFAAAHGYGGPKRPHLPKLCHTYPTTMKLGSYTLPKKDPNNTWIMWRTAWVLLTSAFIQWKSVNFVISRNTDIDCILVHNFYFFSFSRVFKNFFSKPGNNFDDDSKSCYPRPS